MTTSRHRCDVCGRPSATAVCLPCAETLLAGHGVQAESCPDFRHAEGEDIDDATLDAMAESKYPEP